MRGAPIRYSAAELAWIKARSDLPRVELHALFVQVFGRTEVTFDNIKALCTRKGWTAGPDGRRRNAGKSLILTADQTAWLRANAGLSRAEVGPAFAAAFPGSSISAAQIISWRKNHRVRTGRTGRFEKGQAPWSKGQKLDPHPNSQATMFSPGQKPHNARPIGYESLNPDGYVLICVDRPNPYRPQMRTHMAFKHKELWTAAHGPIPAGHVLKCLDGDKTNCDPSNWEAVPQGLLPRLNGKSGRDYDTAPAELKPTILAIAKLEHKAREKRRAKA
jgi:hypothetical protein